MIKPAPVVIANGYGALHPAERHPKNVPRVIPFHPRSSKCGQIGTWRPQPAGMPASRYCLLSSRWGSSAWAVDTPGCPWVGCQVTPFCSFLGCEGHPAKRGGMGPVTLGKCLIAQPQGNYPCLPWPSSGTARASNQVQTRPGLLAAASPLHHIPSPRNACMGSFPRLSGRLPARGLL